MDNKILEIFIPGPAGRHEQNTLKVKKIHHQLHWYYNHILNMVEQ